MNRNFDVINSISKYLHLTRPRVANFADIIIIATIFVKTTLKDTKKVKRI